MSNKSLENIVQESLKLDENASNNEDVVTPWDVASSSVTGVDYDKLIGNFQLFMHIFNVK